MALPHPQGQFDQPRSYSYKLESILDQINSVAVVYDQNVVVQLANRFARSVLGFNPLGMSREEVFTRLTVRDEQDCPVAPDQMPAARAARGEIVENERLCLVNPHGQTFHVIASASSVQFEGEPVGVISVWNDYSEHKLVQEALAEAMSAVNHEKDRLQAVLDGLPVGVAIYDTKGGVLQANQAYENVWGQPRPPAASVDDYALYQSWWVHNGQPVKPEEWGAAITLATGQPVYNQFIEIQRFDGKRAYVLNSSAPLFDSQGRITGCTVAIRDVSERVQSEQALRASEERFRVAISTLPMAVFNMDRELRYTWIYSLPDGLTEEAMLGRRDNEIFPGADRIDELTAFKQAVIDSGKGSQHELSIVISSELRHYHISLEPLRNEAGQITGLTGAMLDITEQRQMRDAHIEAVAQMELQRRLLEHRERERQEVARDIHDGPIQEIVAWLFNLQTTRAETTDPGVITLIDETAARMRTVVQALRDVVNELRPPVLIRYGLSRAIQIHSEDFRVNYPDFKLDLDLIEDERLLPEDTCLALYRIYQECLNNVVRHAHAKNIWVRYYPNKTNIVLEIRDDGDGFDIPADWLALTRRNHFGIAGMRERVQALGGYLIIHSKPGQGTRVTAAVPMNPPKA